MLCSPSCQQTKLIAPNALPFFPLLHLPLLPNYPARTTIQYLFIRPNLRSRVYVHDHRSSIQLLRELSGADQRNRVSYTIYCLVARLSLIEWDRGLLDGRNKAQYASSKSPFDLHSPKAFPHCRFGRQHGHAFRLHYTYNVIEAQTSDMMICRSEGGMPCSAL